MFKGSMVAIVTPMEAGVMADTPIDFDAYERLITFHLENATDAIVTVGTTGESATLSEEEHCSVIAFVVSTVNRRVPVIAGTGANSTVEAIRLTQCARKAGADACLLVSPYYNKPTQEGLYLHHKAVAEAVAIPQILYNVPGRTACDMLPETVGRLAQVPNIIGVKEATGDLSRVTRIRELCGEEFMLVSGDDATSAGFILEGGDGVISVTANVVPRAMHEMCIAGLSGNTELTSQINDKLLLLHERLFCESNPIPVKWALQQMGLIQAGCRLPMTWLSKSFHQTLREAMVRAGVTFAS